MDLSVRYNWECEKTFHINSTRILKGNQFCTQHWDNDICATMTGAPVMSTRKTKSGETQWYQRGIVSWSPECGTGGPQIHTKVEIYLGWINNAIKLLQNLEDENDTQVLQKRSYFNELRNYVDIQMQPIRKSFLFHDSP